MAETFETIKTKLGDWLDVNTTRLTDAVRGDLINIVQRRIGRNYDLRFFEVSDTFTTVDGTRDYALPARWSRPLSLWYQDPDDSAIVFLTRRDKDEFDNKFPDQTKKAKPSDYTVWAGNIQLGKTPDRVLTINRNYYRILADLADGAGNNENDLTKNAWEVLLFGALVEATEYLIEDPRRSMWLSKFKEIESDLVSEHRRERSAGRIPQNTEPG